MRLVEGPRASEPAAELPSAGCHTVTMANSVSHILIDAHLAVLLRPGGTVDTLGPPVLLASDTTHSSTAHSDEGMASDGLRAFRRECARPHAPEPTTCTGVRRSCLGPRTMFKRRSVRSPDPLDWVLWTIATGTPAGGNSRPNTNIRSSA